MKIEATFRAGTAGPELVSARAVVNGLSWPLDLDAVQRTAMVATAASHMPNGGRVDHGDAGDGGAGDGLGGGLGRGNG